MACSALESQKSSGPSSYKYPGISAVTPNGDGTFAVTWAKAPAEEGVVYRVFRKEAPSAGATGSAAAFDFTTPYQEVKDGSTSLVTPNLSFSQNTCFLTRIVYKQIEDNNTRVLCTNHEQYIFTGIASLGATQGGKFTLAWPAVPDSGVLFSVYSRKAGEGNSYNFSAEPLLKTSDTLVETKSFPLNQSLCFLVRFKSQAFSGDANTQELCTSDDGVADFQGIASVTSIISGQAKISWVRSVNPSVVGYRIYQGADFQLRLAVAEAGANSLVVTGMPPGERREFGVRAFDKLGREDDNIKTVSVLISDAAVAAGEFPGCISAAGLDTSRIQVTVAFPPGAAAMRVYRDAVLVSTLTQGTTTLVDDRLGEGMTYSYRCEALIDGIPTQGSAVVQGKTANVNPPLFAGIQSAERAAAGQVRVRWNAVGEGPSAKEFRIYVKPGTVAPAVTNTYQVATVAATALETVVGGLGDELRYSFVVTACTEAGLCSGGSHSVTTALLPDEGIPASSGAIAARMSSGKVVLDVPWSHSMGAVAKRHIYRRNPTATPPTMIGNFNYELIRAEAVSDRYNPPTELEVTGLLANTNYFFVVRDEDPSGNISQNSNVVSVNSGDISAPSFPGIATLTAGTNPETQLNVGFTTVTPEGSGPGRSSEGTSQYLIYLTGAAYGTPPDDPCALSTSTTQEDATTHLAGEQLQVTLSTLTPRYSYRVCVKARDAAGNISPTSTSLTATTQDATAPQFDGLQTLSYNPSSVKLELRWNAAQSATNDVRNYQIVLWRCAGSTVGDCSGSASVVSQTSVSGSGLDFGKDIFSPPLASNEKVSAKVNACDNASPNFRSSDNCTNSTRILSVVLPDVEPPGGFSGIVSASAENGVEGALRATWSVPASWSDYRGFKVYSVSPTETLTLLKDCACTQAGCPEQPTSCLITGLPARLSYSLFARAYDAAGNHTEIPASPLAVSRSATTNDSTPPVFSSQLNAAFVSTGTRGIALSWSGATDNQSSLESGAVINYKVWRKTGATGFTGLTASTPPSDGELLVTTQALSYLHAVGYLTANTTEHYAVCALDAAGNQRCDAAAARQVNVPRLAAPVFAGLQTLAVAPGAPETSLVLGFNAVVSETVNQTTGATDYPIYALETTLPTEPGNACTSTSPAPVFKMAVAGTGFTEGQAVTSTLSGLTPRRKYSICLKARDSLGNESATTFALTAITQDTTAPTFTGLQDAQYNGNTNQIDLSWSPSPSSDVRHYSIKIWKSGQSATTLFRTPAQSTGGHVSLSKVDFPFSSNDVLFILVNACDDAAPSYNSQDNCTLLGDNLARQLTLPDVDPPGGFTGIAAATDLPTRSTGTARITWAAPSDWSDIRGFKIYDVRGATTLLKDCACTDYGCSNQLLTCDVTGLDAGRTYRFYVRAYDAAGNESLLVNPNPITNFISFRTADLTPPGFASGLTISPSPGAAALTSQWSTATDNQYASEPNTIGYRIYRKQGSSFTNPTTKAVLDAQGTVLPLSPDTATSYQDSYASLVDGVTYYYSVCAFDRETAGNNFTCDGVVRSGTVPDITAPTVASLAGSRTMLTRANPSFDLSWSLADNTTAPSQVVVTVRRKTNAASASDFPTTSDAIYQSGVGMTLLASESGVDNLNTYITYRISVVDVAGNERSDSTFAIPSNRMVVPTTLSAPSLTHANGSGTAVVTVSYSGATSIVDNATFLSKVSLNPTGGASCSVGVSGALLTTRTITLSGCTGNGTVAVSLASGTAQDANGNQAPAVGPSAALTVDTSAPALAVTSPAANTQIKDNFTITGSCESGLAIVITGSGLQTSPVSTSCSAGSFSQALTLAGAEGAKVITLTEQDAASNQTVVQVSVVRDSVPPSVTISSPAANTVLSSTLANYTLSGACESGLLVSLTGDVVAGQTAACTSGSFTFSPWYVSNGNGPKTLTVTQTDAAGNVGSFSRSVALDETPVPLASAPTFDAGSSLTFQGLKATLTGTCDSDAAFATTATTTLGQVASTSCAGNILSVRLTGLTEGVHSLAVTATTTRLVNGLSRSTTIALTQVFFCPQGYAGVPGKFASDSDVAGLGTVLASANNADAGLDPTRDFCIMKYPAKVATSNFGGQTPWEPVYDGAKDFITGSAPNIKENYWPESRADSTPWTLITQPEALDRCKALNEAFGHCSGAGCYTSFNNTSWGFRLVSNTEWQVMARNLENVGANWTSGTVGSGYLIRGHSDTASDANSDLHTQTFNEATVKSLSHPRSDAGNSDYFGTGNSASEGSGPGTGWEQRRRFVLSTGASLWDVSGNIAQWVSDSRSDLGIPAGDDALGLSTSGWYNLLTGGVNTFSATTNLIFGGQGSGGLQYGGTKNAGLVYGQTMGQVVRSYYWGSGSATGIFAAQLAWAASSTVDYAGFRCTYIPPALGSADTTAPTVSSVQRTDSLGTPLANTPVSVTGGGHWNLTWSLSDPENTGVNVSRLRVQIRRKIAASAGDMPTVSDPVYQEGYALTSLKGETSWVLGANGQYTRNDGTYVNYLVSAIDPWGNLGSSTFSVQNIQSCPHGYVGVPGKSPTATDTAGLGHIDASAGNSHAQLNPTRAFCVMKYPAKVMSAGTTVAQAFVGGKFEPILNGSGSFAQDSSGGNAVGYNYVNSTQFDASIRYLPESRSSGTPWVNVSRAVAQDSCRTLQMQHLGTLPNTTTGAGFQLLSNTQWQVVARNIEAHAANWSGNGVGSGVLPRGHTDNIVSASEPLNSWCLGGCSAPSTSLAGAPNSWSDANAYFATGNFASGAWNTLGASPAAGAEQKRTFTLSNGTILWDVSGNIWQWVMDDNTATATGFGESSGLRTSVAWKQYNDTVLTANDKLLSSSAGGFTLAHNAGRIFGSTAGGILRGGSWDSVTYAGVFASNQAYATNHSVNYLGFRCAYIPTPTFTGPTLANPGALTGTSVVVTGTCDGTAGLFTTATVNLGRIDSVDCTSNILTINISHIGLQLAGPLLVTATTTRTVDGESLSAQVRVSKPTATCPTGYVLVPGKAPTDSDVKGLGHQDAFAGHADAGLDPTRDFCVMKYMAKVATSNNGGQTPWEPIYDGRLALTPMANYWPESRAEGTPWVTISRTNALDRCKALNEAAGYCSGAGCYSTFDNSQWGYRLMSNTQWQVMARNLESTAGNWSGNAVGSGVLWRGNSDNTVDANTDLHSQTFNLANPKNLSNPRSDTGVSDYFGTGNSSASGQQERRRFVLSNGNNLWDVSGNSMQWVSDNNDANPGNLGASAAAQALGSVDYTDAAFTSGDKLLFSSAGNLTSSVNAGKFLGGTAGTVSRGGPVSGTNTAGIFGARLNSASSVAANNISFRCAFVPPPLSTPSDVTAPSVTGVQRTDSLGTAIANNAVNVATGGRWNLAWTVSDPENTGVNTGKILVQVRRKITVAGNAPALTDPVYAEGFGLSALRGETAWEQAGNGQYTRNDGTKVHYRITATDPAGNTISAFILVDNTKSCPPGYVGVPGKGAGNSDTPGLGHTSASAGNAHGQLDPTRAFCVMKYPAKAMSAGTTAALNLVGGPFEPIANGNNTFTNTYGYADATAFDGGIKYLPESRSSGTPWTKISRDDAISACRAQQMQYFGTMPDTTTGTGFQLISNTQWQVVARNLEAQAVNWSNNAVGSGVLNRGHSDDVISSVEELNSWCMGCTSPTPSSGAPNSWSDANSYFATGNTAAGAWNTLGFTPAAGAEQKRTHTLSNGIVMWDFAGNVQQWVVEDPTAIGVSAGLQSVGTWADFDNVNFTVSDLLLLGSAGGFLSTKNPGMVFANSAQPAIMRGGTYAAAGGAGIFAANMGASTSTYYRGFRCVYVP